ncbi:MAG: proline--tRNA ligase [Spirochaetia bacterium]
MISERTIWVMLYTKLFGKTLRTVPHELKTKSHEYLIRGGFIRSLGQGLFSLLPLGHKVMKNIREIIIEELELLGGQEVNVPMINPLDIWKRSGRDELVAMDMVRFRDRSGKDLVISPTHEEAMVELVRQGIQSYRDLPILLYQFQLKFRDEEKPGYGLIRAKEFTMNDGYSFHSSYSDLNNFFPKVFSAYERIFKKCGVQIYTAESGVGYMGGEKAYEFLAPVDWGDNNLIYCTSCGYKANQDIAMGTKRYFTGPLKQVKKIETPQCSTMDQLSVYLDKPKTSLVKSMVYRSTIGFVMAVVRADFTVSIDKLSKYIKAPIIRLASKDELISLGLVPGYLSPLDAPERMIIVVDDSVSNSANLVIGANEWERHFVNVNFGRDFETENVADIVKIKTPARCFQCGADLEAQPVLEVANIFKLGNFYSRSMGLIFTDDKGKETHPFMGSYGIGMGRLLSAIVETNHDEQGVVWPIRISPFKAFLMGIGKSISVKRVVDEIHRQLGTLVLVDDRGESPGVKFQDSDLLGFPFRIVVTAKHLEDQKVELLERRSGKKKVLPIAEAISRIKKS